MSNTDDCYICYIDGSCLIETKERYGGCGFIMVTPTGEFRSQGGTYATNADPNKMEIRALLLAIAECRKLNVGYVLICTDSICVYSGLKDWVMHKAKKITNNARLWNEVIEQADGICIDVKKIKAHSGHRLADRADAIAKRMAFYALNLAQSQRKRLI